MSDANNEQLLPPSSWEKFEELCADLFSRIWNDAQVVRYGRDGQRQNGVDIYGKENGADSAVQCKGKRIWPPRELTTAEIDAEVEKAKKFEPALKTYIFATTADNDVKITDHVNAISATHAEQGLFRVTVYGWRELTRRFGDYPDLLQKHFAIHTVRQLQRTLPTEVAAQVTAQVVEALKNTNLVTGPGTEAIGQQPNPIDDRIVEAVDRDFANRYERAFQRSVFPELSKVDELAQLATEILDTKGIALSSNLRRTILLRASRSAAVRGNLQDAARFLTAAQKLPGSDPDAPARARLAVAEGRPNEGIQILRDLVDPDSRSVLFSILAKERGHDDAVSWLTENKLSAANLTAQGVLSLCFGYVQRIDLEAVNRVLGHAIPAQFSEIPYLLFLRGAVRFASLLPSTEQAAALSGLPLDVRNARPIVSGPELSNALDAVLNDFRQALPYAKALGLRYAPRIIESYIIWTELLHPTRREVALAQLRTDMEDHALAISRVQYAFAFLLGYSPNDLDAYLQRRDVLGGLSDEELRAVFVIKLHKEDAAGLVSLIAAKRQQAEATFGSILWLEILALAKSGDTTSAAIILEKNLTLLNASQIASLRTEIAKAEGADPVAEHLRLYESEKTTEALLALVNQLQRKKDHVGIAKYAELLFAQTKDPRDIALAAEAEMRAGNGDNFVRLCDANPFLKERDVTFSRYYGWQLFRLGRLAEAKQVAERIEKNNPDHRDLQLEMSIAIETGEWEALSTPLAAALDPSRSLDGLSLIRAAQLSHASQQGALMDLIAAAVAKADDDPNVLMGAYFLFVERGLEDERPEPQQWFQKALAVSGPEGPIQRFEIKELLDQQVEWDRHVRFISERLMSGEFPLAVAAPGLRTTVVDLVLRNLIRNSALTDGRRRVALPLFSGRRLPEAIGSAASIALDITSLLVLGWLGLLPAVLEAFPKIILPADVLAELFEGRSRIRRGQKTRLRKAVEIRDAVAKGQLKVLRTPSLGQDPLSNEIGVELSALIREAKASNGIVVRPAPVHRIGFSDGAEADMQPHAAHLCDMHGLLKALAELNAIDEEREKTAKQYFELQDRGWASSASPQKDRPLFLDGLALTYLQHTRLLPAFLRAFPDTYSHVSTEDEANALIEDDQNVSEVFRAIDDIRSALRQANAAGRVIFGPRRADAGANDYEGMQSSLNLLADLSGAEVVVIDDRALNKELFAVDKSGHRARVASTIDLLEELLNRRLLTEERYRALRFRLRTSGSLLVPVTSAELLAAAKRNRQNEAPEFRAIRDGLDLARVSEMPQFPAEMRWFMSYVQSIRVAVTQAWIDEPETQRARVLASSIFDLRIMPEDWVGRWGGNPPPGWLDAVRCTFIGGFMVPVEIAEEEKVDAYQKWLDDVLIFDVQSLSPELYKKVVEYIRNFVLLPWGGEEDEDEPA